MGVTAAPRVGRTSAAEGRTGLQGQVWWDGATGLGWW